MPDDLELDQEFLVGLLLARQRLDLVTFLVHYLDLDVTWNKKQFTEKSFLFIGHLISCFLLVGQSTNLRPQQNINSLW